MAKATRTPKDESSNDTFVRLAKQRVPKAIKAIRLLGNLTNYEHTSAQTNKIVATLTEEVTTVRTSLSNPAAKQPGIAFDF